MCLRANCTNHVLSSVQRQCEPTSVLAQNSKCNSVPMEEPSTLQYLLRATSSCLIISNVAPFYDSTSWGVSATKTRQSKVRQSLCEHLGTPRPWRQSLRGRLGKPWQCLAWGQLGANMSQHGPTWSHLEANLRSTWANLGRRGPTWPELGPTWAKFGPNLAPLELNVSPTWPNLGSTWVQLGLT